MLIPPPSLHSFPLKEEYCSLEKWKSLERFSWELNTTTKQNWKAHTILIGCMIIKAKGKRAKRLCMAPRGKEQTKKSFTLLNEEMKPLISCKPLRPYVKLNFACCSKNVAFSTKISVFHRWIVQRLCLPAALVFWISLAYGDYWHQTRNVPVLQNWSFPSLNYVNAQFVQLLIAYTPHSICHHKNSLHFIFFSST